MSIQNIGINIAKMRKAKGATQEDLARAVGVSAQAVSKWENGGVPDAELFPSIADFFDVTIDALYGREVTADNVEKALMDKIASAPEEDRFKIVFELLWKIEISMYGRRSEDVLNETTDKIRQDCGPDEPTYSSIQRNEGFTHMGIGRNDFFFFMPEQEGRTERLVEGVDFVSFFHDMAQEDVFDTFIMLYKRPSEKFFTMQLLVKNLGVTEARASEIIGIMKQYGHIWTQTVELDDQEIIMYRFEPHPYFIGLLIFARDMIQKPNRHYYYSGGRNKPYLT